MVPRQARPEPVGPCPVPNIYGRKVNEHSKNRAEQALEASETTMATPVIGSSAPVPSKAVLDGTQTPELASRDATEEILVVDRDASVMEGSMGSEDSDDEEDKNDSGDLLGDQRFDFKWIQKYMNTEFRKDDFDGYLQGPGEVARQHARFRVTSSIGVMAYIENLENTVRQLRKDVAKAKSFPKRGGNDDVDDEGSQGDVSANDSDSILSIDSVPLRRRRRARRAARRYGSSSRSRSSSPGVASVDLGPLKNSPWRLRVKRTRQVDDRYRVDDEKSDYGDDDERNKDIARGGHVLKLRRRFYRNGLHKGTRMHFRSPFLRKAIREVAKLQHFSETGKDQDAFLDEPYWDLFHHREGLIKYHEELDDGEEEKAHIQFLLDFMRTEFPEASKIKNELEAGTIKSIDPRYVWLLYEPGSLVFNKVDDQWQAFKVKSLKGLQKRDDGTRDNLTINLANFAFADSGNTLKEVRVKQAVKTEGIEPIPIGELEYIPANLNPNKSEVLEILKVRGSQYWSYNKEPVFREYVGNFWPKNEHSDVLRVVVDTKRSNYSDSDTRPRRRDYDDSDADSSDSQYITKRRERMLDRLAEMDEDNEEARAKKKLEPAEDQLILCPAKIQAFSLRRKTWGYVNLCDLRDVKFQTEAFDKLVIKEDYKSLVTSMISAYIGNKVLFKDLVKGKGQGLVILLHGAPGIGKTLTAECIAETQKRPLYMLTSGDLGVEAESLETKLREAFELATRWNAVLLLDEADVFLQERDVRQLERNALVSVFLREVEYFDGILFLTTNRPGWLDEAFQSRIHLTLHLPKLEPAHQLRVWSIFLYNTRDVKGLHQKKRDFLTEVMSETLTDGPDGKKRGGLNGREIRNHVMTARALAVERNPGKSIDEVEIGFEDIKKVLKAAKEFSDYMKTVQRASPDERAMQNHWRRD